MTLQRLDLNIRRLVQILWLLLLLVSGRHVMGGTTAIGVLHLLLGKGLCLLFHLIVAFKLPVLLITLQPRKHRVADLPRVLLVDELLVFSSQEEVRAQVERLIQVATEPLDLLA